ncbi:MAG: ACP S-malonyltransferase [Lentisphaeria bacterium]|nr:ACP S-malonyltransferase [Lentisphaeria bacterium]MBO5766068.1 ACP S-malonyltransferase [Lentisphaeria bacterium]MBO5992148.1 ACP S-malonyltransferase [Lentisphaeria bacterium]MBO7153798.1 ACP S-malonyltransferase [Lentisphaeria bacterium]
MKAFYVFSGQGAQAPGMGRDLYESSSAAKAVFDRADEVLGYKLSDIIFNGPAETLTSSIHCQCAIYTMSCAALAAFREKFGDAAPAPVACAGLSLGEYAALYAAGAVSFDDGIKLLSQRGKFMDEACKENPGTMASVLGGDKAVIEEVAQLCGIDVANYNSPAQIVVSGTVEGVGKAVEELKARGMKKVIPLNVAGAFHSRLMAPAGEKLAAALKDVELVMPPVPVYHNRTADAASDVDNMRELLASQVAGSVRWEECLRRAVEAGADTVIEFGPGNVLTGLARRTVSELKLININSAETLANAVLD